MMVGPAMAMPTAKAFTLNPSLAASSVKIACSLAVPPRPPASFGQVIPAHPLSARNACHGFARATHCASPRAMPVPRPRAGSLSAASSSQLRASARKAASSGLSSKSTVRE
jgi:hypothetical protein